MKARLVTREDRMRADIAYAAEWLKTPGPRDVADAFRALLALENPTPDTASACFAAVDTRWSQRYHPFCNACNERAPVVVLVGDEQDYESATAALCPACVREAAALLEGP